MKACLIIACMGMIMISTEVGAQDKVTRCYQAGNQLVCEESEVRPTSYLGKKKWCTFTPNSVITGPVALCAFDKKSECNKHIIPADSGKCVQNPTFDDGE